MIVREQLAKLLLFLQARRESFTCCEAVRGEPGQGYNRECQRRGFGRVTCCDDSYIS